MITDEDPLRGLLFYLDLGFSHTLHVHGRILVKNVWSNSGQTRVVKFCSDNRGQKLEHAVLTPLDRFDVSRPLRLESPALGHSALFRSSVPGRGAARAEDAQGTPTQSHISPSILVYEGHQFDDPTRFSAPKLTCMYRRPSMSTYN